MGIHQPRFFADKKHYKSRIFAKTKPANDEEFDLKKGNASDSLMPKTLLNLNGLDLPAKLGIWVRTNLRSAITAKLVRRDLLDWVLQPGEELHPPKT